MTKEWKDGLPPVGVEVKLNYHNSTSGRGVVTAIGNKTLLFTHKGAVAENGYLIEYCIFTPIKSKQEIERDKVVEEMITLSRDYADKNCHNNSMRKGEGEMFVDAGYERLGEEVSEELLWRCIYENDASLSANVARFSAQQVLKHFKIYPRGE